MRIIGGRWRGRKVHFPQVGTIRPTPDRVRETLFNWLQFELAGRRCLDLFAGSGALGLESLSRGASHCLFVERDREAARAIEQTLRTFDSTAGEVDAADAFVRLARSPAAAYDVVFLDPPYAEDWLGRLLDALEQRGWLAPGAWVYMEDAASRGEPALPAGWTLHRSRRAGDVGYHLARRGVPAADNTNDRGGA